ncbi:hypothetical protein DFH08DRAFT_425317 [Mycena albidolilacea]|uniref:Uncharacterized protein n=1 Tax=Mycena albidolilacea TaxID=1033008 RepID=A0AAD6ZCE2_9AGAR|nr:hypothetical protein DFH08DRAFT_425317 [Mycena albidolilacea]
MALQTMDHTSTPSAPSEAAASSTTTTTDSGSSDSGFSLSSSPPLIIAFLAVGVFAISMVTFFGWRRMTAGRVWAVPAPTVSIGETPKLWDIWSPRERPHCAAEWYNIQPLAAAVWDESPPPASANNGPPRHHSLVAAAVAHLRGRYRRHGSQDGTALGEKMNHDPLVRLQVAVTIAMPCPDFVGDSSRTELNDDEQLLEYSIGLYKMPWEKTH